MSRFHALCKACDWPCAIALLHDGVCRMCVEHAERHGVAVGYLKKVQRVYARCV